MASLLIRRFFWGRPVPRRHGRGKESHRNDGSMSWFTSASVAIAVAHPGHLVRPGLVASLGHEIEVMIGGVHHVEAARVARIGVKHGARSEEHTSELQSLRHLVCRLLL